VSRRFLVPLLCVVIAVVVGVGGVIDHHLKQARLNRAELGEWYCVHRGVDCRASPEGHIERNWNRREVGYQLGLIALGLTATGTFIRAVRG
jgi:hypothetical protein